MIASIIIPVLPYAVFVVHRELELKRTLDAEPKRIDELTYLRGRNAFTFGLVCTPTLFFLGYWLVTYGYHLITGGHWNTWVLM